MYTNAVTKFAFATKIWYRIIMVHRYSIGEKVILDGGILAIVREHLPDLRYNLTLDFGYAEVDENRISPRPWGEDMCECGGAKVHPGFHSFWCKAYKS